MARAVSTQSLSISPSGRIRGGTLNYTFHASTGELHYSGHIIMRRFFLNIRHCFFGKLQLDPRVMLTKNIKLQVIHVKSLIVQIVSVAEGFAHCTLQLAGSYPGVGVGVLDLKDEVVKLDWITGEGILRKRSIFGRDLIKLRVERSGD